MNERCSAILLNKLLFKEKDPGSFTIPCNIGNLHIDNALADFGASISLMPYTMYEKLVLGEPKPTRMSLELADRSIQYPRGIAEDVLIKIYKFVLPIDLVILDMREDSRILIILGRPFLETARAMIDDNKCYGIDDLDAVIHTTTQERLENDNLEEDINRPDSENYGPNSEIPIWRIDHINTSYQQETHEQEEKLSEHLYSASAIEIDEKKPELKDLPSHLEYAYLKGDETWSNRLEDVRHQENKPIYYASKTLNDAQAHYTTTEKELLAVVFSFDKFRPYLILSKTIVYTDHSTLKYLFSKQDAKPRLIRWVILLQGFNIEIKDKKGAKNWFQGKLIVKNV
ncbi:reverse transcriptase domain-containing protein [Tanacetum coccineum]